MTRESDDDLELRGVAMAAFDAHERTVSPADTEAALAAVRSRIDAGDMGGSAPVVFDEVGARRRRSPALLLGAAAAVIGVISLGLVAVLGGGSSSPDLVSQAEQLPPTDSEQSEPVPFTDIETSTAATSPAVVADDPVDDLLDEPVVPAAPAETPPSGNASGNASEDASDAVPVTTASSAGTVTLKPVEVDAADPPPLLDDGLPPTGPADAPRLSDSDVLAIGDNCIGDFNCTQLAASEAGNIVAYDPTTETLRTYDSTGMTLQSEVALDQGVADQLPRLVHVGPDDVAYLSVGDGDASRMMLVVPLLGDNAGSVIDRVESLDSTGDTDMVPAVDGLVAVGCCGFDVVRPAADATRLIEFVDRNGNPIASQRPTFSLVGDTDAGNDLTRIDANGDQTRFWLPTVASGIRGMPRVVATDDGGALMSVYSQIYQRSFLIDFDTDWPQSWVDPGDVYFVDAEFGLGAVLIERSGTMVFRDELGNFIRRTLDQVATPGWGGVADLDEQTGAVTAPGLNDYIAANQPWWASDREMLGLQFTPHGAPNESVEVTIDGSTGDLIVTTTGLLDDSVQATRLTIDIDPGDDGLLRFVSGTYGFQCVEGRGHQDFSYEFCT